MSFDMKTPAASKTGHRSPTERDPRWAALVQRDASFDGAFVYAVATTGIYCRPACPSKLARPENISFFATCEEAEAAGFRACHRCKPNEASSTVRHAAMIAEACRRIEAADEPLPLDTLAATIGLSPFHFHRLFKKMTGVTPKAYAAAQRSTRVRDHLARGQGSVTEAIYGAGFNSNSRFYETSDAILGMAPSAFRSRGAGATIRFAIGQCSLGAILVATTDKGVCAIFLGDDPDALVRDLQDRFPKADLTSGDAGFEAVIAKVIGFVETPALGLDLPLDIQGTAFQQRVWQALCDIPLGTTATYTEIAHRIGGPKSVRAVAGACAANRIAVAIPCHRVVKSDGALSGYRWGVARKQALLNKESKP
jgi:AraC family transcriptional regulator of adaptative response/methylated-DNA-[protein]-cysteine methyltransferase